MGFLYRSYYYYHISLYFGPGQLVKPGVIEESIDNVDSSHRQAAKTVFPSRWAAQCPLGKRNVQIVLAISFKDCLSLPYSV